jgi:hypothetical protein
MIFAGKLSINLVKKSKLDVELDLIQFHPKSMG